MIYRHTRYPNTIVKPTGRANALGWLMAVCQCGGLQYRALIHRGDLLDNYGEVKRS